MPFARGTNEAVELPHAIPLQRLQQHVDIFLSCMFPHSFHTFMEGRMPERSAHYKQWETKNPCTYGKKTIRTNVETDMGACASSQQGWGRNASGFSIEEHHVWYRNKLQAPKRKRVHQLIIRKRGRAKSDDPDSNQGPCDSCHSTVTCSNQLSYRRDARSPRWPLPQKKLISGMCLQKI